MRFQLPSRGRTQTYYLNIRAGTRPKVHAFNLQCASLLVCWVNRPLIILLGFYSPTVGKSCLSNSSYRRQPNQSSFGEDVTAHCVVRYPTQFQALKMINSKCGGFI